MSALLAAVACRSLRALLVREVRYVVQSDRVCGKLGSGLCHVLKVMASIQVNRDLCIYISQPLMLTARRQACRTRDGLKLCRVQAGPLHRRTCCVSGQCRRAGTSSISLDLCAWAVPSCLHRVFARAKHRPRAALDCQACTTTRLSCHQQRHTAQRFFWTVIGVFHSPRRFA